MLSQFHRRLRRLRLRIKATVSPYGSMPKPPMDKRPLWILLPIFLIVWVGIFWLTFIDRYKTFLPAPSTKEGTHQEYPGTDVSRGADKELTKEPEVEKPPLSAATDTAGTANVEEVQVHRSRILI